MEAQLVCVFENIKATLAAAGASFDNVARLTIYVRDYTPEHLEPIRRVRDGFVNAARPPASALTGVAALFHPEVLTEIDAIAVLDPG